MANDLFGAAYNPDVLSCLANLSNDEVFTPPEVVNQMLDLLPQELFSNPDITFLDPACKTGVFLREIAKRLIRGLEFQIPDLQERLDHIFQKQLYGIAITELTSLLSRRSVYCSKYPNSEFSITHFDDDHTHGNIRFEGIQHTWQKGKCVFCGASQEEYERGAVLETHAYEWIHTMKPEDIFDMKFDVIIGNPPYQLSTAGNDNGAQAKPLYHKFIEQAKKLKPNYLSMIIPSRWFSGGWGLDDFRNDMMTDRKLVELHDFPDASDCFPGVDIKGGVCYFLWDNHANKDCHFVTHQGHEIVSESYRSLKEKNCDIVIRYNEAIPILHKVRSFGEASFETLVSTKKPFGFITNYSGGSKESFPRAVKLYANKRIEYVSRSSILRNQDCVDKDKVIVPKAVGSGDPKTDVIKPLYCEPNACCTETYLLVGPFASKEICENVMSYIGTKFFHFLVTLQKNTQDCMKRVYSFVPVQDFSKPWTDEALYSKYGLTEEEIAFIETMVWPND
ncbi:MAG: Eco57I restriction-modification methylase domain-containing protein [Oscillospiraceae bacterium]|nr:Eco57I restriction-modification methylase domain-containing protein [Oscillospiraceae bacterium]